jgi:MoxR-like ATPase
VVRGKEPQVELALVAVLAAGHLLIEDIPGVGKTTLATTLACTLGASFKRVQFTSDLLPADLLGVSLLDPGTASFAFRPGPIFTHVLLADEINRTTPRTQSALLEAMNERRVTVDGVTHELPRPFLVVATQNPHDFHGTFELPDSQLDRFLIRMGMGYADSESERAILRSGGQSRTAIEPVLSPGEVQHLVDEARAVSVHRDIEDYLLALATKTRQDDRLLRGVSTRGLEALHRAVRALALLRGRQHCIPEDVQELIQPVWAHRVLVRSGGGNGDAQDALREILWDVPAPF